MTTRTKYLFIFLTVFINLIGFGIVLPVLPLYAKDFGASAVTIGWLLAAYSIMQCLCAPLLGRLSDRVGRRPVLILSMAGTVVGFLVMGLAGTLWLVFLGRIIDGITGGNISTAQAYIADITEPEKRSKGMGVIGAAFGLGFIFGPAIGGVLSHISAAAPLLFAAGLAFVNTLALAFFLPESLPADHRRTTKHEVPLREVFAGPDARPRRLIMAIYLIETIAFSLLTTTYPLYTQKVFNYGPSENGYLFAGLGVIAAFIQGGLLGRLVHRFGEKLLIIAGAVFSTTSFILLPHGRSVAYLWMATAGLAVGHGLMVAPLNGLVSRSASQKLQGRVLGLMQSMASLGRVAGPILGGWLFQHDSVAVVAVFGRTPYWTCAALVGVSMSLVFFL